MTSAPKANAVVGQSGGPTGVINASLVGVIEQASSYPEIENLYGAVHAVAGMVKEDFIDLKKLSVDTLEKVAVSPSSAIGTSRDKPDEKYCERILDVLKKPQSGYEMRCFHIPKTVDNDLLVTDHCPGFGTAAKFEACALMGDDLDNRALPGVKIDVIMGRHAGFLTAAAVLGKQRADDGPHLVYIPERGVSMEKFVSDVDGVYSKLGRCVIAVSEGMCDTDGVTWTKKILQHNETDSHGNIQLSGTGALADFLAAQVKKNLPIKRVRADTFGYLQRSFAGLQSSVDAAEARACGQKAVELAMKEISGSVAIRRLSDNGQYKAELFRTDLSNVAEKTKSMPDEFINAEGNGITEAFVDYAMPLIGGLPKTEYLGNYPRI
ncbi:MAG: diphosphate--fructose-6-phosphate 1-phosphotransferase [Planctomycetota bacterium]|jgi:6-phosphofructokinase 1